MLDNAEVVNVLKHGLRMEVLGWKIQAEEPTACSLISQALNKAQSVALKTSALTAMAVLTGAVTRAKESAVAEDIAYCTVKESEDEPRAIQEIHGLHGSSVLLTNRFMEIVHQMWCLRQVFGTTVPIFD